MFSSHTSNNKTAIFISNSPNDGFRDGDGDLMDKLTTELNNVSLSITATRLVTEKPSIEMNRPAEHLVVIDELPEMKDAALSHLHPSQQRLVQHILASPAANKILYIGSRIDNFRKDEKKNLSMSVGSGALLTEDVILALKKQDVKIVICCLEVEFHTRSLLTSFRLHEMLRHHLQHADVIHFLTQKDRQYLQQDLMALLMSGARLVHPSVPAKAIEDCLEEGGSVLKTKKRIGLMGEMQKLFETYFDKSKEKYAAYFANFDGKAIAKKLQKIPCVYASGVSTVASLSPDKVTEEKLMQRTKNILVFGLIRSHKGIEEGLALGQLLKQKNSDSIVYIVGKMLGFTSVIKKIFFGIFDHDALAVSDISFAERFSACNKSIDRNKSFQDLYNDLVAAGVTKKANVELALNVSEADLWQYAEHCRYALKLDVKGFAENASSMISTMIGLCLPTIAQRGIVTPAKVDDYEQALCLLDSGQRVYKGEVMPAKVAVDTILDIVNESDEKYLKRIKMILVLRAKRQFDIENTAYVLMESAFMSLSKSLVAKSPVVFNSMGRFASSYILSPSRTPYTMFANTTTRGTQSVELNRAPASSSVSSTPHNKQRCFIVSKL
jgi:hypothetical protein